jgi:hypothetical protein
MEGFEKQENAKNREEIYSQVIRAGKRTYFFDVRSTYNDDYYLTITESKKKFNRQGRYFYEKHKIFLYKEDFDEFLEAMQKAIDFIKKERPNIVKREDRTAEENNEKEQDLTSEEYKSDVDFDSLGEEEK